MSPDPSALTVSRTREADPEWLSIADVARRLSVSTWQVRKWIECGQFDEIVVFSRKLTRISLGSYHRFVAKNQQRIA